MADAPRSKTVRVVPKRHTSASLIYRNSWALVIGVNEYGDERIGSLRHAEHDADAFAALLPRLGCGSDRSGDDHIRRMVTREGPVTRERVQEELERLKRIVGDDDRLIVFVSAHGVGAEIQGSLTGHLLLSNAELQAQDLLRNGSGPFLSRPPLGAWEMQSFLNEIMLVPAKHKLLLLDTCYSGLVSSTKAPADPPAGLFEQWMKPVTQILTACEQVQVALELQRYQHGLFSQAVLEGLRGAADVDGDGLITFGELASYTRRKVSEQAKQNPQGMSHGSGENVFFVDTVSVAEPKMVSLFDSLIAKTSRWVSTGAINAGSPIRLHNARVDRPGFLSFVGKRQAPQARVALEEPIRLSPTYRSCGITVRSVDHFAVSLVFEVTVRESRSTHVTIVFCTNPHMVGLTGSGDAVIIPFETLDGEWRTFVGEFIAADSDESRDKASSVGLVEFALYGQVDVQNVFVAKDM